MYLYKRGVGPAAAPAATNTSEETGVKPWRPTDEELSEIRRWAGAGDDFRADRVKHPNKTTSIMLAGKIYVIRNPTIIAQPEEIRQNWRSKIFTPSEIDFLKELGVKGPENMSAAFPISIVFDGNWGAKVDNFFYSLVKSECFKDTMFLSNRECNDTREFIKSLTGSLIQQMGSTTALGVSDEDIGPIIELEEEKGVLETALEGANKTLKSKVRDFEARRADLERQRQGLIDEIQHTKRVVGMPIRMSGAELTAEWAKDIRRDPAVEGVKQQTRGGELSALEAMVQGRRGSPIMRDDSDTGKYSKPMLFVKRGGDARGETSTGYVFITGAANERDAEVALTAKIAELKREYPGWLLILPG
jgi:hypothetical protein